MIHVGGCCGEVINPVAAVCFDLVHRFCSHSERVYFGVHGVCPPAMARAGFQKDQLFSLLEGEQDHLGTEIRDIVLSAEDVICPLLSL